MSIPEYVARHRVSYALSCANTDERVAQLGLVPAAIILTDDGLRRPYYLRSDVDALITKRNAEAIAGLDKKIEVLLAQKAALAGI